jgi:hypothetical protein
LFRPDKPFYKRLIKRIFSVFRSLNVRVVAGPGGEARQAVLAAGQGLFASNFPESRAKTGPPQ